MSTYLIVFIGIIVTFYGAVSVPIVLKESSPNGESIIAISSSNPEVEQYILNNFASQRANPERSLLRSNFYNPGVQSYSSTSPEKAVAGGRSFGETSPLNPFFVPFLLPPNLDALQLNNWFRNIDNVYDYPNPSFAGDGEVRTATAVNDNGHVYGKVETLHLGNKIP